MFLFAVYILLIICNYIWRKSKPLYIVDFLYMWILMGWNHSVADYSVYYTRYTQPEKYSTLEPLYSFFQDVGKYFALDYNHFLILMSFIFLLIRLIVIWHLSNRPNFVVGLYLLFPFVMDICQIRVFYATSIILVGVFFLVKDKKTGTFLFLISWIVACMIHAACVFYIIILVARVVNSKNIRKYKRICITVCLILYMLLVSGVLYWLVDIMSSLLGFGNKFVQTTISTSKAYKVTHRLVYMIEIILFSCMIDVLLKQTNKYCKKLNSDSGYWFFLFCYKVNCGLLLILPFAWFSGDVYRVQHGILLVFYIFFSNIRGVGGRRIGYFSISEIILACFIVVFVILFLVGLPSLRNTVFLPVFFNNSLLEIYI